MDSLERMNQALAYIEEHIADEIDFRQVERLALCSEIRFRQPFAVKSGSRFRNGSGGVSFLSLLSTHTGSGLG